MFRPLFDLLLLKSSHHRRRHPIEGSDHPPPPRSAAPFHGPSTQTPSPPTSPAEQVAARVPSSLSLPRSPGGVQRRPEANPSSS